jgi:phospholipase/carboxylesterase
MNHLSCLEIEPPEPADGCIIWLHGLGAYGKEFEPVVPHMHLETVRFVFPQALDLPVTINGGVEMPAWFDIRTLNDDPRRESQTDIALSALLIQNIIDDQIEKGIPSWRIVLVGFSQGGAMALHVGLRAPQKLLGIGVLSGYLLNPNLVQLEETSENRSTPIFFGHGRRDLVVPNEKGQRAYRATKNHTRESQWNSYHVGHELCMTELADLRVWFHILFGGEVP